MTLKLDKFLTFHFRKDGASYTSECSKKIDAKIPIVRYPTLAS